MYACLLSQQFPALAHAELESLFGKPRKSFGSLATGIRRVDKARLPRLSLAKSVYRVVFITHRKHLLRKIKQTNFQRHYRKSIAVRRVLLEPVRFSFTEKALADLLFTRLKKPRVDLRNPGTKLTFFFHQDTVVCGLEVWQNTDDFDKRKPHRRPVQSPISLDPRVAKAMVNLARATSIHDPFCGMGGILIEAGLMKMPFSGGDIDPRMVEATKKNLAQYRLKGHVKQEDALRLKGRYPAIVTDLPFGKNTRLDTPVEQLLADFLKHAKKATKRLVLGLPSALDSELLAKKTGWRQVFSTDIYLHKSLSKGIVVLV